MSIWDMDRSERALFEEGQRWMRTPTFKKNANKIMEGKYNTYPIYVPMLPVEITKRLKKYHGLWSSRQWIKIKWEYWKYYPKSQVIRTLRHEYLHEWIWRNHKVILRAGWNTSYPQFMRECYHTFGFEGDHKSYKYRYTGKGCRCWYKSNEVKKVWHCYCGKTYLKPSDYKKAEKEGSWYSAVKDRHIPFEELGVLKKKILISV